MSFVHKCNKNNIYDTKRDKIVWHNKILTNPLQFMKGLLQNDHEVLYKYNATLYNQHATLLEANEDDKAHTTTS